MFRLVLCSGLGLCWSYAQSKHWLCLWSMVVSSTPHTVGPMFRCSGGGSDVLSALLQQSAGEEVQTSVSALCGRLKELEYQEDALSALTSFLQQDLQRYQDLHRSPDIRPAPPSMHGKSETDHHNNMVPSSTSSTSS